MNESSFVPNVIAFITGLLVMYRVGVAIWSVWAHWTVRAWTRGNWFGPTLTALPRSWFFPIALNMRTAAVTASSTGLSLSNARRVFLSDT